MKVFKAINANGQVSYSNSVKKAMKSNPIVIQQTRGLIVPIR